MAYACVQSRGQVGLAAPLVRVEVHVGGGLPQFGIVGLAAPVVRESKDRVRAALASCGFDFPAGRVTVSLAPAELPKEGGRYDLPIALGILLASNQVSSRVDLERVEFYGELGLTGALQWVQGLLLAASAARQEGRHLCGPLENGRELRLLDADAAWLAPDLPSVIAQVEGRAGPREPATLDCAPLATPQPPDLRDVRGQAFAKRALLIAAAGGHHLLLEGPPGSGKSLLAQRLPGLLPALDEQSHREVAAIHSLRSGPAELLPAARPPFRAPHHTASAHAIVGGGPRAAPGEVSLAHRGVLFLDELPEFDRRVLEALREPLENGAVTIARATQRMHYPAEFQLVAAMNACPCGKTGGGTAACDCAPAALKRYRARLSGPLRDRIDLHVDVQPVGDALWESAGEGADAEGSSQVLAARVGVARDRQLARQGCVNARLSAATTLAHCALSGEAMRILARTAERYSLSARGCHRIARVARSIADLNDEDEVVASAILEAIGLRLGARYE